MAMSALCFIGEEEMSDAKGPYSCAGVAEGIDGIIYRIYGPGVETLGADFSSERGARIVAVVANAAYAEGRKAGRASREGLREGLELVLRYMEKRGGCSCIDGSCPVCFAQKALEADGEGR